MIYATITEAPQFNLKKIMKQIMSSVTKYQPKLITYVKYLLN